ncbi:MAG: hypothetical protein JWP81_2228 [Ferruginibacter sp.]|nr:hypothetical protein [Ferruginibacter sp.]
MKKLFAFALLATGLMITTQATAQNEDKSKRPSPPAKVTAKLASGANISIDYSQPSVKGRTIGKDLEPMEGKVWRTGANEATVFETDKDVTVQGQSLPAGKYALFTIFEGNDVTLIFSKTWKQWGAFTYKMADDALRVKTTATVANPPAEKLVFTISNGIVSLVWANKKVDFQVK